MGSHSEKIPVWLDCDPVLVNELLTGHDDAFAILLAAYHPAIELLGISTIHGNASVEQTTENAGRILTAIGRPEIDVYKGKADGLERPSVHAPAIHGESGIDGTSLLPKSARAPVSATSTLSSIISALLKTPRNTAWLIATGALTNIAGVFLKCPELVQHIKGLSIMGGAVGGNFTSAPMGKVGDKLRFGNWTPYAEFNIVCDPEAASLIFKNFELAAKTVLIPLDVTHQVLATREVQELLLYGKTSDKSKTPSDLRKMFMELLNYFAQTYAEVFGITDGPPLHDPLAVAVILDGIAAYEIPFYDYVKADKNKLDPERHGERERYEVNVVTEGTHTEALAGTKETGRTIVRLCPKGEAGVKIPRGLNVERFWAVLEVCLQMADARIQSNMKKDMLTEDVGSEA